MARAPDTFDGRDLDSLQFTDLIAPALYSPLRSTMSVSLGPGFGFGVEVVRGAVGSVAVGRVVVRVGLLATVRDTDGVADGAYLGV
ncbi:hypothetical protein GCM10009743_60110 [Kribbella swartbergensis]